jgi:hypothetical protein
LFVHGMGRSPLSGWPIQNRLRRAGLVTSSFGYGVSWAGFETIQRRLAQRILGVAAAGEYVLIGHSLGGVLIRAAVNGLPAATRPPRHVFLLGSPVAPARLAHRLAGHALYRVLTRDCGQLLGSRERMAAIGALAVPTTSVVGTSGPRGALSAFRGEPNDGVVSLAEVSADWITDQVQLPVLHTLLPMSPKVARVILDRLALAGPIAK